MGKIEEIIFYHGSLAELNSRDKRQQYGFAKEPVYVKRIDSEVCKDTIYRVARTLKSKGYDGLVNVVFSEVGDDRSPNVVTAIIQGTPVVKKKITKKR